MKSKVIRAGVGALLVLLFFIGSFMVKQAEHYRLVSNQVEVTVTDRDGHVKSKVVTRNLRTNGGADWYNAQLLGTSAAGTQANYMALSTDSATPAATDSTLTSEQNNTYGLGRAQGTVTHSASAVSTLVSHTWTYTGSSSVQVNKVALFTASSSGTMVFVALLPYPQTVNQNGDQVTINYTVNF